MPVMLAYSLILECVQCGVRETHDVRFVGGAGVIIDPKFECFMAGRPLKRARGDLGDATKSEPLTSKGTSRCSPGSGPSSSSASSLARAKFRVQPPRLE